LGVRTWFFCGEFVVECVVKRGVLVDTFSRQKTGTFLEFIFGVQVVSVETYVRQSGYGAAGMFAVLGFSAH
jgi:hypothetical protein